MEQGIRASRSTGHAFLQSTVSTRKNVQFNTLASLPPEKDKWIGILVGPRAGLDALDRRRISYTCGGLNRDSEAVHPEHYTDYDVPEIGLMQFPFFLCWLHDKPVSLFLAYEYTVTWCMEENIHKKQERT
jgi:hypothetical protein